MSSVVPKQPTPSAAHLDGLTDALRRAFGTDFRIWTRPAADTRPWLVVTPTASEAAPDEDAVQELLQQALQSKAPQIALAAPSICTLAVPFIESASRRFVAVAEFAEADEDQLLRQARLLIESRTLARQNDRLRAVNGSLTLQVTENFEDLAFVRALASHLQLPGKRSRSTAEYPADPRKAATDDQGGRSHVHLRHTR
jgi:hypothetical protein